MVSLTVKLHYVQDSEEDIRRVSVDEDTNFAGLASLFARLLSLDASQALVLRYKDDEGDMVTVAGEADWSECKRQHTQGTVLHLFLGALPTKPESAAPIISPSPPPAAAASSFPVPPPAAAAASGFPVPVAQLLQQFGVTPGMAMGFLSRLASASGPGGAAAAAAAPAPAPAAAPPATGHDNNSSGGGSAEETTVRICDECETAIDEATALRFTCIDCAEYDAHEACRSKHAPGHRFVTQYAREADVATLMSMAAVSRDLAVETLNLNRGNVDASVEQLLNVH